MHAYDFRIQKINQLHPGSNLKPWAYEVATLPLSSRDEIAHKTKNNWAVGSLVVRASNSRPEDLGSFPDATKYPPSTHGVRAR
ncbi:hypothetical protein TNCV_2560031 [Trichonephila clavipes]|nr:hypothetical protein TNCV_2560031 [Trichonephila clavipes]